jgi:hypothetical protein
MDNTKITASKNGAGMPPTRRSRQSIGFLEATVITTDGQVRVEHDERNDALGRKLMDAWCWKRNESAKVLQIAVEVTDRRAGYKG